MDYRQWKEKQERSNNIWNLIIVLSFICFWPVGIVLVLMKNAGKLPVIGTGQTLKNWQAYFNQFAEQKAAVPPVTVKQQQREKRKLNFGRPMLITGLILAIVGLLALVGSAPKDLSFLQLWRSFAPGTSLLASGIVLSILGSKRQQRSKRLQQYADMIDSTQGWLSIYELADQVKRPYKNVCEDLQKMTEMGIWDTAWLDLKRGRLMFTPFEPQCASAPQKESKTESKKGQPTSRAEQVLRQIRADNDLIADDEISRKIDRIETLTGKIFSYLEQHPERENDLRTFMDYYLPQTLKTLEAYARLEAQGIETASIREAKIKISDVLDKLSNGYEKQLDKLFETDALDISADIAVMERMLKKDGLAQDDFVFDVHQK